MLKSMHFISAQSFQNWASTKWTEDITRTKQSTEFFSEHTTKGHFSDLHSIERFVRDFGNYQRSDKNSIRQYKDGRIKCTIYSRSGMCGRIDEKTVVIFKWEQKGEYLMLVKDTEKFYGVYWTTGISSVLLGIYASESYDYYYDVLEQFAQDNNCSDFAEFLTQKIEENDTYCEALDNCEDEVEYYKLYEEFQSEIDNCYFVEPIDIEIKKGE